MGVSTIKLRRGSSSAWSAANPILSEGEPGLDTTLNKIKIGDGSTDWNSLPFYGEAVYKFDPNIKQLIYYDSVRNKWLADAPFEIHVGRSGNLAPGSSFRFTDSLPTSTNPILLERNCTLVGIVASTSAAERFVIRVDDVSGGSGTQTTINYEAPGPVATTNFIDLTLNADYNANDRLDIYVLSSNTGNISNPLVKLIFRYRV
jgi:hypothetical protein